MRKLFTSLLISFLGLAACEPAYAFKIGGLNWVTTDGTSNQAIITDGAGNLSWKTFISSASISATPPLTYNSGTGVIAMPAATSSADGYLTSANWIDFNNRITGLTGDVTATGPSSGPAVITATVATVGGQTAANVAAGAVLANASTSANTASTIVRRGASGEFSAGTVTATFSGNLTGNVTGSVTGTASGNLTLATPHNHGVLLSGSANATSALTPSSSTVFPLVSGGSSADPSWASLTVPGGGTGVSSFTSNGMVYGQGSSALAVTAAGSQYQTFQAGGSGVPTIDAVHLDQTAAVTGVLPNANTTAASANTASAIVARDSAKNFLANNATLAATSTVSSAGTATLTVGSSRLQVLTGTTTHTYVLPDATTLGQTGFEFDFVNNSTGTMTINDGGSTLVGTIPGGGAAILRATSIGSTAGAWAMRYQMPANASYGTSGMTITGGLNVSGLTASQAVFTDSSKNLTSNTITGSGDVVMSSGATLVGPALGTPTALVGTNITGTASGLTAGHVTTNANLTGPITSSGNATSIAAQTGTGTTFVMDTSPTIGGQLGLISAASSSDNVGLSGTTSLSGATQRGFHANFTATSAATTQVAGFRSALTTAASTTVANIFNFISTTLTVGSSGTATRMTGYIETGAAAHPATNNASFADNATYTGNWFLNESGTDASTLGGALTVGGALGVTGATTLASSETVGATGTTPAALSVALNTTSGAINFSRYVASTAAATINLRKTRATTTVGTFTGGVVTTGDALGRINFEGTGTDEGNASTIAAAITGNAEGTIGSSIIPGNLQFTTANASGVNTLALTLDSSQNATFAGTLTVGSTGNFLGNILTVGANTASSTNGGNFRVRDDTGTARWLMGILGSAAATNWSLYDLANSKEMIQAVPNGAITLAPAGTAALTLSSSQVTTFGGAMINTHLSTGTNADTVCLKADGTFLIQAAACTISSKRFKEDISPLSEIGLKELLQLKPVEFKMKEGAKPNPDMNYARMQIGLIAEDVEKVDKRLAIYEQDGKTPKSYRQEAVISLLVKAVQEQQKQIEELKKHIH